MTTAPRPAEITPRPTAYNPGKGCSFPVSTGVHCSKPSATVDGICGRRCEEHKPQFDPDTAVDLAVRGLPGAAGAYVRAWEET